jgi:ATP-binding cassette, subfamily B (MDR/TAP), member 1
MGIATWYFMWVWGYVAEINVKRIRERYLRAVLRQEIAFFDTTGAGEVATHIQTNTREEMHAIGSRFPLIYPLDLVQMGMSEKVGIVVQYASSFFTGFIRPSSFFP